jgi:hypothetical protein
VTAWLKIFTLTYVIETPIYGAALREQLAWRWSLLLSLILNLATHPIVWFLLPRIFVNQINYALFAEAFAVTVEALIIAAAARLREWPRREWLWCFGLAFVANAVSATVGEVLYYVLEKLGVQLV